MVAIFVNKKDIPKEMIADSRLTFIFQNICMIGDWQIQSTKQYFTLEHLIMFDYLNPVSWTMLLEFIGNIPLKFQL